MSADTPDISPIQIRPAAAEPTIVTFGVRDPEVLLALSEYPEGPSRTNFLVTALKVGVLSLKAARGTLDADNVRREPARPRQPRRLASCDSFPEGACEGD